MGRVVQQVGMMRRQVELWWSRVMNAMKRYVSKIEMESTDPNERKAL